MSEPRIIKKYPNRRLYDTAVSKYITLEDVRQLVLQETSFCVRDAKSNADITRSILLQIILEREEDGDPIFSEQILSQFIRFYGDSLQGMITRYLEGSMSLFVEQQGRLREQMKTVLSGDPLTFMREMTEQNLSLWKELQEGFLNPGGSRSSQTPRPSRRPTPGGGDNPTRK